MPLEDKEILAYKVQRVLKANKVQGDFQEKQVDVVILALRDYKEVRVILVPKVKKVILVPKAKKVILVLVEKQGLLEKMEEEHLPL